MNHQFVIMWSCEGLEYVADITADQQRVVWEKLKGNDSPRHAYQNPLHLRLRAQYNPQRHYEIYFIDVAEGIAKEDIEQMFRDSPQTAADMIREKGDCFYSNRAEVDRMVIV